MKKGFLLVLLAPGGVGKDTIIDKVIERKDDRFIKQVSSTTRAPREGEKDGNEYFFKSKEEFENMIENGYFLEYAEFCGNYYGIGKKFIVDNIRDGKIVILHCEINGLRAIKKEFDHNFASIFILPPSMEELRARMERRGIDSEERINERMVNAVEELKGQEECDYKVINDDLETAVQEVIDIADKKYKEINNG